MLGYFILLLIMTMLGSVASLFLKKASGHSKIQGYLFDYNLYIGGILYLSSSVLNILILRKLDYSVVLPLTSITYIWTMLISYTFLKESITNKKLIGVLLILVGAICTSVET